MIIILKKKAIALYTLSIGLILAFLFSCATVTVDTVPTKGWPVATPESQGMRSEIMADMLADINESSNHIDSLLIIRNGHKVLDAYFWPFSQGSQHDIHGCTTSIMSALIGIAIEKGYIQSVNQPIAELLSGRTMANMDDRKKTITIENLLTMTSGLDCRDSYRYRWAGLRKMQRSGDWAQHVLDLPMSASPGDKFEYCNGVAHLLSVIVQHTTGIKKLYFAKALLFKPLGNNEIGWAESPRGVGVGWGKMRLKPDDMAKLGWLYLNMGRWGERQIIPSAWVEASTRGHIDSPMYHYGYQWWVDSQGSYAAVGYKGQRIFVVPEKNLVAVFTGDLAGRDSLLPQKLLNLYIIPAAASPDSLPANTKEQARLDDLIHRAAAEPTGGMIWISKMEGVAKDGIFTRTASPAFKFEYPAGSKKSAIRFPDQIMRMKSLGDLEFSASVSYLPVGMELKDFGPEGYTRALRKFGSNIEVTSHRSVTLKCGTPAYRTNFKWLWQNYHPLTTLLVSAYKDGHLVLVSAHPSNDLFYADPIVESLTFN